MALIHGNFDFTGRLGDISAYRMKGCDRTVVRTKGGPSAHRIKNDPNMAMVRRYNSEFGVRAQAMSAVSHVLRHLKPLADFNYSNAVTSMLSHVQPLDTVSALGQRHVLFSRAPQLWVGFSMNEKNGFDSVVRAPVVSELSRETLSARIDIPELVPGFNLHIPEWRPVYRLQLTLGLVSDFFFDQARQAYGPAIPLLDIPVAQVLTEWHASAAVAPATTLQLDIPREYDTTDFMLMLGIGIAFGVPGPTGRIVQMKNAGAAKVLACG